MGEDFEEIPEGEIGGGTFKHGDELYRRLEYEVESKKLHDNYNEWGLVGPVERGIEILSYSDCRGLTRGDYKHTGQAFYYKGAVINVFGRGPPNYDEKFYGLEFIGQIGLVDLDEVVRAVFIDIKRKFPDATFSCLNR